jgi:hypothetical protein
MVNFNRRKFLQASAASYLLRNVELDGVSGGQTKISKTDNTVRARGAEYAWEWSQENDQFRLLDKWGLVIASGKLQPAFVVQGMGPKGARRCTAGKPVGHEVRGDSVRIRYEGVNGSASAAVTWRFDDDGFWLDPVVYETPASEDVVSLYYFAQGSGDAARPSLACDYLVLPGTNESSQFCPILTSGEIGSGLRQVCWLGHSWTGDPNAFQVQAWGLPVHYFCGFHRSPYDFQKTPSVDVQGAAPQELVNAFCCGLAELPNGDLFFEMAGNRCSPIVSYRSDLWQHLRGPGRLPLGARLYWAVGPNFYEAIRRYYLGLVKAGVIRKKTNSPRKNAVALAPSFCTFGEQVARDRMNEKFDEATLTAIYEEMKRAGMKVKLFVVDGYWEGKYGSLHHSPERFPHFAETLARIRSEGHYVGLWAAFMRCQDPAELGLTTAHMLHLPDGKPFVIDYGVTSANANAFYILDCSQPEVQKVLRELAKGFVRRYRPDFVKFDFGYELPSLAAAAPQDMSWAGERMLLKAMELVVGAMREENPDLVVLYYSLSPLFIEVFDLHSPDDLGFCTGDFDLEANRRFFFSSLLGEIGMPTWGSSGYDWVTAPEIWFDSAAIGTLGNLTSFSGPEAEALAKPERIALGTSNVFSPLPLDVAYLGPARGAHASSWARIENGEVVLVALRERRLDGRKGAGAYRDLVQANTSVVVASKTSEGIARAPRLAVVPYGQGQITLKRESGDYAEVTEHYFGGGKKTSRLPMQDASLRVPLRERSDEGSVIEWIELDIRAGR